MALLDGINKVIARSGGKPLAEYIKGKALKPGYSYGGANHIYTGKKMKFKDAGQKIYTDDDGKQYVKFYHWTQPGNVESILSQGLKSGLGPDAKQFEKAPGVWTSYRSDNPMNLNYVTDKYVNEEGFDMVPLEIKIPVEEYEKMAVDHTGATQTSPVAVFRGEPGEVVIPKEYISEYTLPENWTYDYPGSALEWEHDGVRTGRSLPGWRPGMPKGTGFEWDNKHFLPGTWHHRADFEDVMAGMFNSGMLTKEKIGNDLVDEALANQYSKKELKDRLSSGQKLENFEKYAIGQEISSDDKHLPNGNLLDRISQIMVDEYKKDPDEFMKLVCQEPSPKHYGSIYADLLHCGTPGKDVYLTSKYPNYERFIDKMANWKRLGKEVGEQ